MFLQKKLKNRNCIRGENCIYLKIKIKEQKNIKQKRKTNNSSDDYTCDPTYRLNWIQ
jgi:hypothetical protein